LSVLSLGIFLGRIELTDRPPSKDKARCAEGDYANCDTSPEVFDPLSGDYRPANPHEKANRDEYRAERDLIAQQDMAFWAAGMFFATLAGVILIYRTLLEAERTSVYARKALKEAQKTTAAANRTVDETTRLGNLQLEEAKRATAAADKTTEVTRTMGQIQVQAYVIAESATVELVEYYPSGAQIDPEGFHFKIACRNTGQSPAHHLQAEYKIEALIPIYEEGSRSIAGYESAHLENSKITIPDVGAQSLTIGLIYSDALSAEAAKALTDRQLLIEITGDLGWLNEFGKAQFQPFCFTTDKPIYRTALFKWDANNARSSPEFLPYDMTPLSMRRRQR
jgi:hypothetical protein